MEQNKQGSLLILELVEKMVQRKISIRSIEGPIGIGRAAGQAASKKGWTPLLELTAGISLNLGIFNLLPIPIMDGGVILLLFVESIMRRDISLRIKERIYQAAFVFLVLFAVMVIYNDMVKMLPGVMGRMPKGSCQLSASALVLSRLDLRRAASVLALAPEQCTQSRHPINLSHSACFKC